MFDLSNDKQLILSYLEGNEDALGKLIKKYLSPVYNFVYQITGNTENAEDITQETFLKIWKKIHKFHTDKNFKTWLFTIAHNTAIDFLRKKRNLNFADFNNDKEENILEETISDTTPLPLETLKNKQAKEKMDQAIQKLPPIYREVILLRYNENLTFEEIGKILKRPMDTVKSQHRRALNMLKKFYAPN